MLQQAQWKIRQEGEVRERLRDQEGFRIRAAGLCIRGCGENAVVLLVSGGKEGGLWVIPGGGVEKDESCAEAAQRELEEEAGVKAHAKYQVGVFQDDEKKHRTSVFFMEPKEELDVWDEGVYGRQRAWIPLQESPAHVKPAHRIILNAFISKNEEKR